MTVSGSPRQPRVLRLASNATWVNTESLKQLLDAPDMAIWAVDAAQRVMWMNRIGRLWCGKPQREILGRHERDLFPPQADQWCEWEAQVLRTRQPVRHQREVLTLASGQCLEVEIDRVPYWKGAAIVGVIICVHDITDRVRTENTVRLNETRYRTILDEIHDGYFEVDLAGNLVFFNVALSHILGYPANVLYGMNNREYTDAANAKTLYQAFNRVYRTGEPVSVDWQIIRQDGTQRYLTASVALLRDDHNNPIGFRGLARDITETKTAELRLHFMAHHDLLTELPNRTQLMTQLTASLEEARQGHGLLALLFIDLDRFKHVNDTLGHLAGDQLLRGVAERIRQEVRHSDIIARMGGDEFIVVLWPLYQELAATAIAARMIHSLQQPWVMEGHEFRCPASIGIALYPEDGQDATTLLKHADMAMYQAKTTGGNRYALYAPMMSYRSSRYVQLETQLHQALAHHDFRMHYQPQVDSRTGRIIGAEALVRWQHPDGHLVAPHEFISFAEQSGLIVPLGRQVIAEVCRQMGVWQSAGLFLPKIAVNLSASEFQQPDLVDYITKILQESGVPPACFAVEMTESAAMQRMPHTLRVLGDLRTLGVAVALDDFGMGFSSLRYLKDFPITALKIEQSFVRGLVEEPKDRAVIKTLVEFAQYFDIDLIAEGVETPAQLESLQQMGCFYVQGYLFSQPLPADAFDAFARSVGLADTSSP
ncbi:MAG: GGDEF domain-containing protein [Sulfobacillus benefaciens]|uniref:GGDEF domain-containing protein n=1 Tax=Sulfobacillus benefaciens TaxID=453960 RepID=A0A2T2XCQ5_9FIRM|nr:MAG: GGDEF domain-containing protein [Sulfobacillus benefaciens]